MATLTTSLSTTFTPAVGDFHIQTNGLCQLIRRNTSGAAWSLVQTLAPGGHLITNSVASTDYQVTSAVAIGATQPTIQVDQ